MVINIRVGLAALRVRHVPCQFLSFYRPNIPWSILFSSFSQAFPKACAPEAAVEHGAKAFIYTSTANVSCGRAQDADFLDVVRMAASTSRAATISMGTFTSKDRERWPRHPLRRTPLKRVTVYGHIFSPSLSSPLGLGGAPQARLHCRCKGLSPTGVHKSSPMYTLLWSQKNPFQ